MGELTVLFAAAEAGDAQALDRVFTLLYPELESMARARLRRGQRVTMADTGALVHESWLRLQGNGSLRFEDRGHFLAHAARVMRSVITDLARRSQAQRRGGDLAFVTLDTAAGDAAATADPDVLDVAQALDELAVLDARLAQVVEMRWFAGLAEAEIAVALGLTERTVRRDWAKARAFLVVALRR
ncbi:MAG: ECF-type sigma factor [Pseudomonadota bacterium]|nr:ECF-type sigma factor [Pseudomonadota bacterium]